MKKKLILVNIILLLIAIYTFLSLYNPSVLHFINSDYVNGKYIPKGGNHLTDEIFLSLFHYLNLILFYILNIVYFIRSIKEKYIKGIIITIISILLMLSIYSLTKKFTKGDYQVIETEFQLNE